MAKTLMEVFGCKMIDDSVNDNLPDVIVELLDPNATMPAYANETDSCADVTTPYGFRLYPGETIAHPVGIAIHLPEGWEAQVRGRSGLAAKGLDVHYGTIDHLYRKEIHVIMRNESPETFVCLPGDRIAQLFFQRSPRVNLIQGKVVPTKRGGLGSTGMR